MNSDMQEQDIKTKFLPKERKLCEQVNERLRSNEPLFSKHDQKQDQKHDQKHDLKHDQKHDQKHDHEQQPVPRPRPEDDMSYFVCSLIAAMNSNGLVPTEVTAATQRPDFRRNQSRGFLTTV